jgi:cation-transporting ATPase E
MGDVMRLFLARTLSVMLVVFGTALLQVEFPITPKHNSILALLTVGIPALVLATWARPGVPPKGILRSAIHFVVPAAALIATLSLAVYMLYHSLSDDIVAARTALTTTAVLCGVILILFVEPPKQRWVGGDELSPDRRPIYLAGVMLVLFVLTVAEPIVREFYELEVLDFFGYIVIGFAVLGWTFLLRTVWRMHPFEWLAATWRQYRRQRRGR